MLSLARSAWCIKAELNGRLIQKTTMEAPQQIYVLRRPGRAQENDQLLREGRERPRSPGRKDRHYANGTGRLDEDTSAALDGGDGGDDLHGLDSRLGFLKAHL
jgi:hypothetical protein